jgi:ABC-type nitrate/sulfonate/bicarbonate transport system substrate-binding protein
MKKILSIALVVATCFALAFGVTACGNNNTESESVSLVGLTAASSVGTLDCDYYVAAEPAASLRAKVAKLNFNGNLQTLYGEEGGYPQAVIVAKNSLIESNSTFIQNFLQAVENNTTWLSSSETEISTIVNAVKNHLPADTSATFNETNLTKAVISNCGIKFVSASNDKTRVQNYISEIGEIDNTAVGTMVDGFFYQTPATLTSSTSTVNVYMPDGAPALALAQLMAENMQFDNTVNYNVVVASTITSKVSGTTPDADICVLPSNAASKILGNNKNYTMLGTVTNGNLYILSANEGEITSSNIATVLKGKSVGVINLSAVPGLTFKLILKKYGVKYEDAAAL